MDDCAHAANCHYLVEKYLPLARSVARRFRGHGFHPEELAQEAAMALLIAASALAESPREAPVPYLRRSIRRHLSRVVQGGMPLGWRSRAAAQNAALLAATEERLSHELGRHPTDDDLCEALGWTYRQYLDVLQCSADVEPFDEDTTAAPEPWIEAPCEFLSDFEKAVNQLPAGQKRILQLRACGLRCCDIAKKLHLSAQYVSRVMRRGFQAVHEILHSAA